MAVTLGASPLAAALPYERDRKRAADMARLSATPAPALVRGFRQGPAAPGGGDRGIDGYYRRERIRRINVLGERVTLYRMSHYEPNSAYEIRGRVNGRNLTLAVN